MTVTNDLTIPGGSQHIAAKARLATLDELERRVVDETRDSPSFTGDYVRHDSLMAIIAKMREDIDG